MAAIKENLKQSLRELHDTMGIPGCEQEVIRYVRDHISPYADELEITTIGTVIAVKKGNRPGPNVAIGAHMDEIGFVVKNILPTGFLLIDKVGGVPDNIMLGRKVLVSTKRIPGIIGTKPGHLQTPEEAKTIQPVSKCYVDVGLDTKEEVEAAGICIGDPIIFKSDFNEMANPDLISTRAIDDRIGCSLIIEMFKNMDNDFAGNFYGIFTVREEAGLFGARNALTGLDIDYSIALDTIPAGGTPDLDSVRQLPVYLGKGPGLPITDGVGHIYFQFIHPGVRRMIEETAAKNDIPLKVLNLLGYGYATDASAFSYANRGIPTATLTVPRRYSHSPVELININDAVHLYYLLTAIVKDNENIDLSFI